VIRAAVVTGPGEIEVQSRPDPRPGVGEAVVAILVGGICGTDIKVVHGDVPSKLPIVLGHELVGEIVEAPSGSGLDPGTRVVIDPSRSCGRCATCRRDLSHLCPLGGLMGRDFDGGFAELVAVPATHVHRLAADMSLHDAAFVQVLSTCIHAQEALRVEPRQASAVVGLGVSGLLHVQLLREAGLEIVLAVGRSPEKRELAARLGATAVASPEEAVESLADLTAGEGADIVVESAGTSESLRTATALAARRGQILQFGTIAPAAQDVPTYEWYRKELTLVNTRASRPRDLDRAAEVLAAGRVVPSGLVTASYEMSRIMAAVAAAERREHLKVLVEVTGRP
jgi:2-desacetyl-2-hydroxyethyl bacteriochlorophyllide A dehydrogenase